MAEIAAREYLEPLLEAYPDVDTLLLGCTHFPVLANTIQRVVGPHITLVDSAAATAQDVAECLRADQLLREGEGAHSPTMQFFVTDGPERFIRVANRFIGMDLPQTAVSWVDLHQTPPQRAASVA